VTEVLHPNLRSTSIGSVTASSRVRRVAIRVVTDEYLDLYILGVTALAFTVLGILGVYGIRTLSSIILALLAILAFSQIRSRKQVSDMVRLQGSDPFSIFRRDFPDDAARRRANASTLLLIGVSMARTVQSGSRTDLRSMLLSGGRIRVLVLNPDNDELVQAASRRQSLTPDGMRRRIQNTLDELAELHGIGKLVLCG
jgi:hypothetical protein